MIHETFARAAKSDETGSGPNIGNFELTKLVREFVPIVSDENIGGTLGNILDDILADAAMDGAEVQSVTLNVDSDYWTKLAMEVQMNNCPSKTKSKPAY